MSDSMNTAIPGVFLLTILGLMSVFNVVGRPTWRRAYQVVGVLVFIAAAAYLLGLAGGLS
jgi:hypothetical protein